MIAKPKFCGFLMLRKVKNGHMTELSKNNLNNVIATFCVKMPCGLGASECSHPIHNKYPMAAAGCKSVTAIAERGGMPTQ